MGICLQSARRKLLTCKLQVASEMHVPIIIVLVQSVSLCALLSIFHIYISPNQMNEINGTIFYGGVLDPIVRPAL